MCEAAKNGTMSLPFKLTLANGCDISDFCCLHGKSCVEIVKNEIPKCLASGMAAAWNNGIDDALTTRLIDGHLKQNMIIHSSNMEILYDLYRKGTS